MLLICCAGHTRHWRRRHDHPCARAHAQHKERTTYSNPSHRHLRAATRCKDTMRRNTARTNEGLLRSARHRNCDMARHVPARPCPITSTHARQLPLQSSFFFLLPLFKCAMRSALVGFYRVATVPSSTSLAAVCLSQSAPPPRARCDRSRCPGLECTFPRGLSVWFPAVYYHPSWSAVSLRILLGFRCTIFVFVLRGSFRSVLSGCLLRLLAFSVRSPPSLAAVPSVPSLRCAVNGQYCQSTRQRDRMMATLVCQRSPSGGVLGGRT
jgi:hypothetical protein